VADASSVAIVAIGPTASSASTGARAWRCSDTAVPIAAAAVIRVSQKAKKIFQKSRPMAYSRAR
jgi:hypothetical protein